MTITYESLAWNKRCIYQAFSKVKNISDTPSQMGKYVNDLEIDADDEKAVIALAKKYGFTKVEGISGKMVDDEVYRFENNAEIIAIITGSATVKGVFKKYINHEPPYRDNPEGLLTDHSHVTWHAVYGSSDSNHVVTWKDDQGIYRKGPTGTNVSVCFTKK